MKSRNFAFEDKRGNREGDCHSTRLQVKIMPGDQTEETMDMKALEEAEMKGLHQGHRLKI